LCSLNRWQGWRDFFGTNGSTEDEFSVEDDDDPDEVECVRPEIEGNGGAGGTGGGGGGTAISSTPSDDVEMEEGVDAETAAGSRVRGLLLREVRPKKRENV